MLSGPDLDPYRPTPSFDGRTIARRVARTLGVLAGVAISLFGLAIYVLRCFDSCPSDPAQDNIGQLLSASAILFGLLVLVAAASAGTRWSRPGLTIVAGLGVVILLCGVAAVALVPAIEVRGDHSGSTTVGVVAILGGGLSAAAAWALRRPDSG